ncbi:MAG: glycosyltransferase family 2 protein, partial [Bacteroidetes bacterium]|nr:glycosyltransferase family 2 protein [Bacteroidota bacterium]
NYNGKHLLEMNLPSVYAALRFAQLNFEGRGSSPLVRLGASISYEVIVIDDASVDDSIVFIQQQYPDIKLLVNESNKGFSPTINKGIFAAQHELVLALNSDVQLKENYFIDQLKYFEALDTFGVMGKIIDLNGSEIQDGAKYPKTGVKGIKTTFNYIPLTETNEMWLPSFFLSGANALMNREKLWQLGGFDELYAPYYYEDADLGIRAWRVGWKCYFEPQSVCMHAISSTIGKLKSEKVKIIIERNRIILNHLHLMNGQLLFFKCWLWIRCFSKLIKGNVTIYKAIQLFRKERPLLDISRQNILKLQTKNKKQYTVYDTERFILKKIRSIKYRVF